jgi:signal transduction histidine kinase
MPDGGTLTLKAETIPNSRVRITFEDTGNGMTPEQVERLFEPFSNSTSGGTGLGLSIVYQIIRDHNGTINVRSSEGEGTTITIELPREKAAVGPDNGDGRTPIERFLKVKPEETKVSS